MKALALALAHTALLAALLLGLAPPAQAAEQRIEAMAILEPGQIGVDELASFTITVTSGGFGGLDVHPAFEVDNLEVAGGPFQTQSQRWVNGTTSSSLQLTWRLRPKGVGPARVRAITLTVEGQALRLSDKEIQVQQQTPAGRKLAPTSPPVRTFDPFEDLFDRVGVGRRRIQQPAASDRPKVFLRAELQPPSVYVGQQTTYTLWLYTQTDVGAFQPTHMPAFRGFWVREIPQPAELKPEWLEQSGERFGRVAMLRRALFPLQEGHFTVEPTEVDLVARLAEIGPFGAPFGRSETLHLKTESVNLDVQALPPSPPGFTGAVGDLAVSARLDRSALSVGEAATLTIRTTGRGNLQSLKPPQLPIPEGLRAFPPRQENTERLTEGTLVSSQEWSYVLVPQRAGSYELAALALPFFDPATKQYRSATTRPLALSVSGEAAVEPGTKSPPATAATPTPDGAETQEVGSTTPGPPSRPWLWAAGGGVLVVGLLGAGALLRTGRTGRPPGAKRTLAIAVKTIATAAAEASPRETAAALEEAFRHHLESRFDIAPGTPVSQRHARLIAAKVDPATATALAELTRELHYLRYAPELAAADALRADALLRARRLSRALR